jgi:DNA-directed RNA polymerase sigma subunit (sigma70/sigma32)
MKTQIIRWDLSQDDIAHLSTALQPVRTYQEVAGILGLSESLVRQIETCALRKIIRTMTNHEENGELEI